MLLSALKSENRGRPPVWLMRQAGRYLPAYRKLREKHTLRELFFTPELAAQVTLLPLSLGVDAAILFSDITVVALALGFALDFSEGPVITGTLQPQNLAPLQPIAETIRLLKPQLTVPLIGFCGGPFTVASYINGDPALLEPITQVTIDYLRMQEEAGVDAIQIFDSWADRLTPQEFQQYCVPYLKRLVDAVDVPVILFMRGACQRVDELIQLNPDAISFDWGTPLSELRKKVPMALQGNLNPDLLYEPLPIIAQKTQELLDSMRGDPGFIVNLGHGVKPDVPVDAVRCLIDTVRNSVL
ncbi:MAG TPA: uroporphyrinogen decarboxylase family protein [Chlamydiales bacterium]|nr:uroporphyrinogen decarboxylase family protein [Chlamydiales bacterium]